MSNGVDFKKVALDNRDQLNAALERVAVLERKNANQCESIRKYQDREAQLLSDKMDDDNTFNAANEKLRRSEGSLQQSLASSEQKIVEMFSLLQRVYDADLAARHNQPYNVSSLMNEIESVLNPAEEPKYICDGCGSNGWTGNCDKCIPY